MEVSGKQNTCVRPVTTYDAEARADTVLTQQLLRTNEMRIVRTIHGMTLRDRIYSEELRKRSGIKDIDEWVNDRRRYWAEHVERMSDDPLQKIVLHNRPGSTEVYASVQRKDGRKATTPKTETNWMNRYVCLFERLRRRRRNIIIIT